MMIFGVALKWIILLITTILVFYLVYKITKYIVVQIKNKRWKIAALSILTILIIIISIRSFLFTYNGNNLPSQLYCSKEYVMNLDEVKESGSGTKIKLGKVLLDINGINFSIGAKGKDKIVGIEIKRSLEDKEILRDIKGIWIGDRFVYEFGGFGAGFGSVFDAGLPSNNFIDPVYIICYLSNGEEVNFKVEDKKNIKGKTEIINVDKILDYNGSKIRVKRLIRGINYTSLSAVSDLGFFDAKFYILQDGKVSEEPTGSGGGGMSEFYFKPINEKDITIKCVIKNSGKEFLIKVR